MLAVDRIESGSNDDGGDHSANRYIDFHDGICVTTSENICRISAADTATAFQSNNLQSYHPFIPAVPLLA